MDTLSALTEKSIKQEIELSALTEKSTKQEIEISFLKEEIDVLKKTSVMQNAKTSALVEASSTGDPVDDLEERVSENEKNLKELTSELEDFQNGALMGIDEVQSELDEYKDSATAVCGFRFMHSDVGIITYETVHAEADTHNSLNGQTGKFRAFKKGVYQVTLSAERGYTEDAQDLWVFLRTTLGKYEDIDEHYILFQRGLFTEELAVPLSATRYVTLEEGEEMWLDYYNSASSSYLVRMKFCV